MRVPRAHLADASVSRHGATRARGVAALLVLTVILIADTIPTGPLAALRNWVFDAYERHWPRPQSGHQTLIIDIDTESIRDIGQWPWPRDQLARLVEIAAAARVIGIDLLLTEPDRLGGRNDETDAQLAANLRRVPVVLAAAADPEDKLPPQPIHSATPVFEAGGDLRATLPRCRSAAWPYSVLATAASGIGLVTVPPEADGIIRRMPTVESVGPLLIPSFGIEVVRVASRADRISLRTALATAHGIRRTAQIKYCDEDLLARDDRHIGILVIVEVLVLGLRGQCRDRMRHQAQLTRYTPRSRRYWQTVAPDPSSAWRRRSNLRCGRPLFVALASHPACHFPGRVRCSLDSPPKRHEFEFSVPVRVPHWVKILIAIQVAVQTDRSTAPWDKPAMLHPQ